MIIKLSEIVGQFLDGADYGESEYAKAYRIAIRGWRQLNWDAVGVIEETCVDIDCDMTVCIPDNTIKVVGVGVITDNGKFASLTESADLTGFTGSGPQKSESWHFYDSNFDTVGWSGSVGRGSEQVIGEYKMDLNANKIILNIDFPHKSIILRTLSHPKFEGEYVINELVSEALLAFIRWQWHLNKKGVGPGEKEQYRREWFNEKRLAQARVKAPIRQVMGQISRQRTMAGVKG